MPFEPWKKHEEEHGQCKHCGISIPDHAVYSHKFVNGDPVFTTNPHGKYEPCHTGKPL
jgi:hypothetical protein